MKYIVKENTKNPYSYLNNDDKNIISKYFKLKNVDKLEKRYFKEIIYTFLKNIYISYSNGIDIENSQIYLDEDFLISAGNINVQLTWMDAKVDGVPVTPRNGKSVEINAMWYNAVKILEEFSIENNEMEFSKELNIIGSNIKTNFEKVFKKEKDGLKDTESSDKIRSNQLFSISLTYPVIEKEEIVKDILEIVEKKLLNRYGLKTLAKYEDGYIERYFGDEKQRDRKLSSRNIMAMAFRIIL